MIGTSTNVTANSKCKGRYTFIKFKASAVCFMNPLTTGRYLGIMTTKSQALQLCEVEVYSRGNSTLIITVIKRCTCIITTVIELAESLCWGNILSFFSPVA